MRIAVIPDTHFPYVNIEKLEIALDEIHKFKPQAIIQVGDLYDQLSFSNYPKDPSKATFLPKDEMSVGREMAV
jgi:predicted phosphodiesterase